MNKFVTGALALAFAGSATYADPGNGDWLKLDSEINSLAPSIAATGDYTNIKVLLRGGYTYGTDDLSTGDFGGGDAPDVIGENVSGVRFWDAEINGGTQVGDVKVRLGFDLAGGTANMQDGYALWGCGNFDMIVGQYKPHVTRSSYTDPENLFFLERSLQGTVADVYGPGFGARGTYDAFSWYVDIMNGIYGTDTGHYYLLRGLWNFGRDAGGYETDPEDAYGAGDDPAGTIGLSYQTEDETQGDTDTWTIDGQGTFGQIGWGFEYSDLDEHSGGTIATGGWNLLKAGLAFEGDSNPFMIFGTYMLNEQFGVGVRYEDMDNGDMGNDNTVITLGVNMYDVGHNGKIGVNVASISDDRDDSTVFQAGYTFGASR